MTDARVTFCFTNTTARGATDWLQVHMPPVNIPWPQDRSEWFAIRVGSPSGPSRFWPQYWLPVNVSREYIGTGLYSDPEYPTERHVLRPSDNPSDRTDPYQVMVIAFTVLDKKTTGPVTEVEITAECYDETFLDYFSSRLAEIAQAWPEARDDIDRYLTAAGAQGATVIGVEGQPGTSGSKAEDVGQAQDKEQRKLPPKCRDFRRRLETAMKHLIEEEMKEGEYIKLTGQRMAEALVLDHDYVRELSSNHKKCCGFDWIMDVRERGLLPIEERGLLDVGS